SYLSLKKLISKSLSLAFVNHLLFLSLSAISFVALLHFISPAPLSFFATITIGGAYIFAWLAGLLTPGAPAGAGVREAILLLLLNGIVANVDLLLCIIISRITTVIGDALFFLAALLINRRRQL